MTERESNLGSILIAFAAGAIVGAGIALLYAPQSGEETRRMIAQRAEDLKCSTQEKLDKSKEFLNSKKDQIAAAYEAGKEGYRDAKGRTVKESEAPLS